MLPPGFLGAYDGDIDAAGNRLRKYLFRFNMPEVVRHDATYPKVQWNAFGATGKQPGGWNPSRKNTIRSSTTSRRLALKR